MRFGPLNHSRSWLTRKPCAPGDRFLAVHIAGTSLGQTSSCSATEIGFPTAPKDNRNAIGLGSGGLMKPRLVIIELGAGMAVPSVRVECECQRGQLIRVNPRDTEGPSRSIILAMGALEAIRALDELMA